MTDGRTETAATDAGVRRSTEPRISIIVPAMNEAKNLEAVLPQLPAVHEVILIDGHSIDGTVETAQRVMPEIRVVHQTRRGKGNALACGFEAATGDVLVMFDADGSADPAEISAFVETLIKGADFAKGSRFRTGGGSHDITRIRRMGNWSLNTLTNVLFRSRYSDLCYGYNAFWRDVLPVLDLPATAPTQSRDEPVRWGDGFEIETVITCRVATGGLKVVEVPSIELLRIHGVSNLNAVSDGLRVLRTIVHERTRRRRVVAPRALAKPAAPAPAAAPCVETKDIIDLNVARIDLRDAAAARRREPASSLHIDTVEEVS